MEIPRPFGRGCKGSRFQDRDAKKTNDAMRTRMTLLTVKDKNEVVDCQKWSVLYNRLKMPPMSGISNTGSRERATAQGTEMRV